jgi:hypothetical protein
VPASKETVALLLPEDEDEPEELELDDEEELVNVPGTIW